MLSSGLADYSMADYGDLLMAPDREHEVLEALVDDLERDASWDELWLQELPETSQTALILPILARRKNWYVDIRDASETYTVDLPSTPDEYLARLSQNTRKALRRRWNKLSREHAGAYHTVAPGEDPLPALETLFDLHTRRWQHEGQGGIFRHQRTRAFHRDAARSLHAAGMLDLTLLSAAPSTGSGQAAAVAAQYCLDFNGRRLFYINGHEPGAEWQSFGLGFITDVARVEAAVASGLRIADFGRSEGEYKARYGPERRQNLHLRIFRSRAAYLRCRLYLSARETAKPAAKKLLSALRKRRAAPSPTASEEQS
jgi:CelD/BcsL family acetyltransferase involved in cellulose biosynthesis